MMFHTFFSWVIENPFTFWVLGGACLALLLLVMSQSFMVYDGEFDYSIYFKNKLWVLRPVQILLFPWTTFMITLDGDRWSPDWFSSSTSFNDAVLDMRKGKFDSYIILLLATVIGFPLWLFIIILGWPFAVYAVIRGIIDQLVLMVHIISNSNRID